jgi:hypothetical protein
LPGLPLARPRRAMMDVSSHDMMMFLPLLRC